MSLLMQALKKAEHAKQKQSTSPAADSAADNNPPASRNEEISLSPMESEKSPSASGNLDTLGLELTPTVHSGMAASAPPDSGQAEPAQHSLEAGDKLAPQYQPAGQARFETDSRSGAEQAAQQLSAKMRLEQQKTAALEAGKRKAEQEKAKTVFASKQPNPNRRTLWIAIIGLTIVLLFFGAGYYYLQITPQNSGMLVKTLPIQAAPTDTRTAATDTAPSQGTSEPPVTNQDIEAAPRQTPRTRQAAAASGTGQPEQIPLRRRQQPVAGANNIEFRQTTTEPQVSPALNKAYQSFLQGDLSTAQQHYQIALQQEPNNRDALLGLAAIAVSKRQAAQAGSYYLKLVELDPSDPDAIAGITSLQGGDPSEMESRLKKVLIQHPQAGAIMFALGNLYAGQSRWSDAQQSYFNAYGTAPGNPDYAFNLAVSLDRLNQGKLALTYYQRALSLAQSRPGTLNKNAVQGRIDELQSAVGVK